MRALSFAEFGGPLTVGERPDPVAPPGGAVVEVAATGLCRSDWHAWMGHDPDISVLPHVPGHEFAGVVVAVGEGVSRSWLGRRVTAPFVQACGVCAVCRAGDGQVCPHQEQPGFTMPGSYAEQVVVVAAETNLVALPDEVPDDLAAGLGCRVATAYRGLVQRARVTGGEWVSVHGCGGVGLAAIAIARSRGARVVAVDPSPVAREQALALGADSALEPGPELLGAVREVTGGGAHVSVEALGSPATLADSVEVLRRRGRQVQIGLLPGGVVPVPMGRVIAWELDLLGSHGMAAADYPPMLADIATGRLDLARLMAEGGPIGLAEGAQALPAMSAAPVGGIRVLDPRR